MSAPPLGCILAAGSLVVLTACGGVEGRDIPQARAAVTAPVVSPSASTTEGSSAASPGVSPTRADPSVTPDRSATPSTSPRASEPAAKDPGPAATSTRPRCSVPATVTAARVVRVRSSGTTAKVSACRRQADGSYVRVLGPYAGYVGYGGVAARGTKREGDGKTPAGAYRLRGGFGWQGDPGLAQGWFGTDSRDVWVDDPDSVLYNTHQRKPVDGRWDSAEDLLIPAYRYAQVIGYNEARTPGLGSAIFLHVSAGRPTAGCVSLPASALLRILRWERRGAVIVIT